MLDWAQKFCDKTHRLTGLSKFKLEKWAVILWGLLFIASVMLDTLVSFSTIVTIPMIITIPIVTAIVAEMVRQIENREARFLERGILSQGFWHFRATRIIALLVLVFLNTVYLQRFGGGDVPFLLDSFRCVVIAVWIYVSACIPRPPEKSKARQWCEKGLGWFNDKLVTPPEPVSNR